MAFANNPKVVRSGNQRALNIAHYPEAASQSFTIGELVYLASGAVTACATDTAQILGIALSAASGTTGTDIPVEIIRPDDIVRIRCTNNGTDTTCENLVRGVGYGLYVASNVAYVDKNDTTNDRFDVVRWETDAGGSYTYWAYCTIPATVLQYATGA